MAHCVYFTAAETDCDTQALALAYLETLMASYPRVGVFRSFTNGAIDDDAASWSCWPKPAAAKTPNAPGDRPARPTSRAKKTP